MGRIGLGDSKVMGWRERYIAVDWGTTNRRAYAVNGAGVVEQAIEDGLGIMSLSPEGFDEAVAALRHRLRDAPLLLPRMIRLKHRLKEAPHNPLPAGPPHIPGRNPPGQAGRRRG